MWVLGVAISAGSAALSAKSIRPKILPKIDEMKFVLKTSANNYSFSLNNATELWMHKEFNKDLPFVLLVTGWKTNFNQTNDDIDTVYSAYKCRGNVNFVVNMT